MLSYSIFNCHWSWNGYRFCFFTTWIESVINIHCNLVSFMSSIVSSINQLPKNKLIFFSRNFSLFIYDKQQIVFFLTFSFLRKKILERLWTYIKVLAHTQLLKKNVESARETLSFDTGENTIGTGILNTNILIICFQFTSRLISKIIMVLTS